MSMSGQQIYENFAHAPGTGGLESAKDELDIVRGTYETLGQSFAQAAARLEEHWQGDASGAAARGAGPLVIAHDQAAMKLRTADGLLENQISSFHSAKNTVKPVPEVPKDPATFSEVLSGNQTGIFQQHQLALNAAAHNIQVMDQWAQASGHNGSAMPTDYGRIDPGAFSVTEDKGKPGTVSPVTPVRGFDGTGRTGQNRDTNHRTPNPPVDGHARGQAPQEPSHAVVTPARSTVDRPGPPPGRHPGGGRDEVTTPDSHTPPKPAPDAAPAGQGLDQPPTTSNPPGAGAKQPIPGPFGPGAGVGSGQRGRTSDPRSGSGGPGSGAPGAGKALGEGRGSGTGGTRGGVAEPVARGTANARGGTGVGPGVAGQGGKGKREEDREHRRRYVLEDDAAFQLTGDEGDKAVDPRTGMSPVPPVIGQ
ncbi:PPE domain-containing protein [Amycolatopsis samaneae]|uniref:PPE domain-containing protein n=1 Tax=Amycolatopsis samaneae TaxID=664691 RepID=A0ABW5GIZ1_9PSEU